MRLSVVYFVFLTMFATQSFAQHEQVRPKTTGWAMCDANEAPDCLLLWKFPGNSRNFVFVQGFDFSSGDWITFEGPINHKNAANGISINLTEVLVRVLACPDKSGIGTCMSSSSYWVPLRSTDKNDYPETLAGNNNVGVAGFSGKATSTISYLYNLALLEKLVGGLKEPSKLVPMTLPDGHHSEPGYDYTWIEHFHYDAFLVYERARTSREETAAWSDAREAALHSVSRP